jgi:hypothetical protein
MYRRIDPFWNLGGCLARPDCFFCSTTPATTTQTVEFVESARPPQCYDDGDPGVQFEDPNLVVGRYTRQVLWRDEYKLSMLQRLGDVNEGFDNQLARFRIHKDIKFVQNTKGSLQRFAQCDQKCHGGIAALATTVVVTGQNSYTVA